MKFRTIFIIISFTLIILILALVIYNLSKSNSRKQNLIHELKIAIKNSNHKYQNSVSARDSLNRINAFLAKYRILTEAMTFRDSVTNPLKYKIGDVVRLKVDSSRAIINDIIIGGSKFSYYVKYKVLLKNRTEEEVIPEMIY